MPSATVSQDSVLSGRLTLYALGNRHFVLLFLCLILSSCATVNTPPAPESGQQEALQALDEWLVRGLLNIRSENEARTVNLMWQQQQQAFDINLSGTLGFGTVLLSGDDTGVVMEQPDEAPWYAESLSDISRDWLGYDYPAANLLYWIRGLPAPDSAYRETRGETGLLTTLQQGEWQLQFDRYETYNQVVLPGRIRLDNGQFRLTFIIRDWDFSG